MLTLATRSTGTVPSFTTPGFRWWIADLPNNGWAVGKLFEVKFPFSAEHWVKRCKLVAYTPKPYSEFLRALLAVAGPVLFGRKASSIEIWASAVAAVERDNLQFGALYSEKGLPRFGRICITNVLDPVRGKLPLLLGDHDIAGVWSAQQCGHAGESWQAVFENGMGEVVWWSQVHRCV